MDRVLMRRLAKVPALRLSNWEVLPLCPEQQQYAALDALASLHLYQVPGCTHSIKDNIYFSPIKRI